jgi:hypothetical protein
MPSATAEGTIRLKNIKAQEYQTKVEGNGPKTLFEVMRSALDA